MILKLVTIGSLCFAGVLASLGVAAHAGNINTSGVICQNYNASQAMDIDYLQSGARNLNVSVRSIICAVPRSPLPATATSGGFYVDGHNNAGISTSCTVTATNYTGAFLGSQSFTTSVTEWDQFVSFPSAQLPMFGYVSVLCTLAGNGNAVLRGVTAIQP